jgi:hypothetical protein
MRYVVLASLALSLSAAPGAAPPLVQASTQERAGRATHYGTSYNGRAMGCGGVYRSADPGIIAVPPSMYRLWPCGTALVVTGPAGQIVGRRTDACPGCDSAGVIVDLSEAGHSAVCGVGTCWVTVRPFVAAAPAPTSTAPLSAHVEPEPEEPELITPAGDGSPWLDWRAWVRSAGRWEVGD